MFQLQRINDYEIKGELGRGSFGMVYLVQKEGGEKYAMKTFPHAAKQTKLRRGQGPSPDEIIRMEIAIMKKLSHPNLVNLIEVGFYNVVLSMVTIALRLSRSLKTPRGCIWFLSMWTAA
jgi:serine/threonine protein kinase